jgi:hypothetical protein
LIAAHDAAFSELSFEAKDNEFGSQQEVEESRDVSGRSSSLSHGDFSTIDVVSVRIRWTN